MKLMVPLVAGCSTESLNPYLPVLAETALTQVKTSVRGEFCNFMKLFHRIMYDHRI